MAQSLFKPVPHNKLATKAQSFPRKSSNTASPMTVRHTRDFTWNRGCSSNSPPLKHGDQIPHPLEDSDNQIPSSPGWQRFRMPGVCPAGGRMLKLGFDRYISQRKVKSLKEVREKWNFKRTFLFFCLYYIFLKGLRSFHLRPVHFILLKPFRCGVRSCFALVCFYSINRFLLSLW